MSRHDTFTETGRTAVQQNIQGTLDFLRQYPPFDAMDELDLSFLVNHCILRFYAQGESVIAPEDGPVEFLYIVKQGRVFGDRAKGQNVGDETTFELTAGDCFPIAALLGERATRTVHVAEEDTFCFLLEKQAFVKLMSRCEQFREFCVRGISSLLKQVNLKVQNRAVESLGSQVSMDTQLADITGMRPPVTCTRDTLLHEAVQIMQDKHVGSIVIVDALQRPLGIFTLRDLRRVVANPETNLRQPIHEVMIADPFCLSPEATAFDAALAMTEHHIAHVCLAQNGRIVGMVSERDLFSLRRVDLVHLARAIRTAPTLEKIVQMRGDVRELVERMIAHGASPEQATRLITLLNDHTTARIIELCLERHGDPGVKFTWLAFGSQGRAEQALYTDQDNGIIFEAETAEEAQAIRQKLLPIAREINIALDDCGFTLCKGNVMAGNAEYCLSSREWLTYYSKLIRESSAKRLIYKGIFFDIRAVWGDEHAYLGLQR